MRKKSETDSKVITKVPAIAEVCELIVDNDNVAIVKFHNETEEDKIKLLAIGCFNGTENLYCVTKRNSVNDKQYVKSINIHNESFTFDYGGGSNTCVSSSTIRRNNLIKEFMKSRGVRNI
ncbi:MAG: hypothetical protein J6T10_06625 [Methanobrevibacter sp.]|nr:hypothetical protein [Methanobrevibacter sp.]